MDDPHLKQALQRLSRQVPPPPPRAAKPLFPQQQQQQQASFAPSLSSSSANNIHVSSFPSPSPEESLDPSILFAQQNRSPRQKRFASHLQAALENFLLQSPPGSAGSAVEITHVVVERNVRAATVWWRYDEFADNDNNDGGGGLAADAHLPRKATKAPSLAGKEEAAASWLEKLTPRMRYAVTTQLRLKHSPKIEFRRTA